MGLVKDGELNKERIKEHVRLSKTLNLSISPSGQFRVNSYEIPYSQQRWFFEEFGLHSNQSSESLFGHEVIRSDHYTVTIGNDEYSCQVVQKAGHDTPCVSYTKNGIPHCDSGPAYISEITKRFYKDGKLHNLDGPALVRKGSDSVYAIDGKIYDKANYILNHPRVKKRSGIDPNLTYLDDTAVLTAGSHTAILREAGPGYRAPENFLLSVLYKSSTSYEIEEYHAPNSKFNDLFRELKSYENFGIQTNGTEKVFIGIKDFGGVRIVFDKRTKKLHINRFFYETEFSLVPNVEKVEVLELFSESDLLKQRPRSTINLLKYNEELSDGQAHRLKELAKQYRREKIDQACGEIIKASKYGVPDDVIRSWDSKHADGIIDSEGISLAMPSDNFDIKKEFSNKFTNELDRFMNKSVPQAYDASAKVYGVSIPWEVYTAAKYNTADNSFYWTDSKGEYHSPDENLPAVIFPNGKMFFFQNGFLHRESGPAVQDIYDRKKDEWYLLDKQATRSEVENLYSSKFGKFYSIGYAPKIGANNVATSQVKYSELHPDEVESLKQIFRDNVEHLRKFETDIKKAAEKALLNKGIPVDRSPPVPKKKVKSAEEQSMGGIETKKKIRSAPDLSGTRTEQLVNGFKFGFKKGIVNNSSHILAEKVASLTPFEQNEWFERFLQVCFLLGAAEAMERMPEGMAEKMRMDEEFRLDAASMCRYISGENLGRDLVDIAANILPLIVEVIQNMTAEDLADLNQDFEEGREEDGTAQSFESETVESDDLFEGLSSEEKVKEKVYEEVMA